VICLGAEAAHAAAGSIPGSVDILIYHAEGRAESVPTAITFHLGADERLIDQCLTERKTPAHSIATEAEDRVVAAVPSVEPVSDDHPASRWHRLDRQEMLQTGEETRRAPRLQPHTPTAHVRAARLLPPRPSDRACPRVQIVLTRKRRGRQAASPNRVEYLLEAPSEVGR